MTVSPAPLSRPTALQAAFRTAMGSVCTPVSVVTSADLLLQAPNTIVDSLSQLPQFGTGSAAQGASSNVGNAGAVETAAIEAHGQAQSIELIVPPLATIYLRHDR